MTMSVATSVDSGGWFGEREVPNVAGAVVYPSGARLAITDGDVGSGQEHWDPNRAGVPLVDAGDRSTRLAPNFRVGELTSSGGRQFPVARIDPKLVACLQEIRNLVGRPVVVTSGYRSWGYNKALYERRGKKPTKSRHCSGQATDIKVSGLSGLDVAKAAVDACGTGLGLGIGRSYAHIDVRGTYARWTYMSGSEGKRALRELNAHVAARRGGQSMELGELAVSAVHAPTGLSGVQSEFSIQRILQSGRLAMAIAFGERDVNKLTNMLFFDLHPERDERPLRRSEPNFDRLANEWEKIRDEVVRPQLRLLGRLRSVDDTPLFVNYTGPTVDPYRFENWRLPPKETGKEQKKLGRSEPHDMAKLIGICVHKTAVRFGTTARKRKQWQERIERGLLSGVDLDRYGMGQGIETVTARLALHERFWRITYHWVGLLNGDILHNHPISRYTYHGNGSNEQYIGIAAEGNLPGRERDRRSGHDDATDVFIDTNRSVLKRAVADAREQGAPIEYITAHRCWSPNRKGDPGELYWREIVLPLLRPLKLKVNYELARNDGRPIPIDWDPNATHDWSGRRR